MVAKAQKIAQQAAKRAATAALLGELPAKIPRVPGGGNLPGATQPGTEEVPPTPPPTGRRKTGGLFVTP